MKSSKGLKNFFPYGITVCYSLLIFGLLLLVHALLLKLSKSLFHEL